MWSHWSTAQCFKHYYNSKIMSKGKMPLRVSNPSLTNKTVRLQSRCHTRTQRFDIVLNCFWFQTRVAPFTFRCKQVLTDLFASWSRLLQLFSSVFIWNYLKCYAINSPLKLQNLHQSSSSFFRCRQIFQCSPLPNKFTKEQYWKTSLATGSQYRHERLLTRLL